MYLLNVNGNEKAPTNTNKFLNIINLVVDFIEAVRNKFDSNLYNLTQNNIDKLLKNEMSSKKLN